MDHQVRAECAAKPDGKVSSRGSQVSQPPTTLALASLTQLDSNEHGSLEQKKPRVLRRELSLWPLLTSL
jgi:hypothetical protein